MRRRHLLVLAAATLLAVGCSDDDDSDSTGAATTPPPESTTAPTTDAPATTDEPTTTVATTTVAPTTTLDVEALKAQIAADYERSAELLDELVSNPTVDGLDEKLAMIMTPGTEPYEGVREFVVAMVERGERVVNGVPDHSSTTVENVELVGEPPYTEAIVTSCAVTNRARVDSQGIIQEGTGILVAIRNRGNVQLTPNGWLPSSLLTGLEQGEGLTACPPPE